MEDSETEELDDGEDWLDDEEVRQVAKRTVPGY
jgi:hypothetical protein